MLAKGLGQLESMVPGALFGASGIAVANDSMPWYCSGPDWFTTMFGSCVPTTAQQVQIMRSHFGPSADMELVDQATQDFSNYLINTDYQGTVDSLKKQDVQGSVMANLPLILGAALAVGVVSMVLGDRGPMRYGR